MTHDPLLQYEKQVQKKHQITKRINLMFRSIRVMAIYCVLTGAIFAVLMAVLNFSAYNARISNWINPEVITGLRDQIQNAISTSVVTVHASDMDDTRESLEVVKEKIALTDPELVYSRTYDPNILLSGVSRTTKEANFEVAPYENRIVIPRLGKNIPLIDVDHDATSSYDDMHEVFMEELQKGVVRYPGTAHPGEVGNAFIFGHSSNYPWIKSEYNDVFALVDTLQNGDDIIVYYHQKKYLYRVTDRVTVKPGDTAALKARDQTKKEISLMTCWPVGTTLERYIVFGELVESL
jgi:LPXTG-site transpeptidase (sortase) family protein